MTSAARCGKRRTGRSIAAGKRASRAKKSEQTDGKNPGYTHSLLDWASGKARGLYTKVTPLEGTAATPPERIDATFLTSAPSLAEAPRDTAPEVAFAGRSNAGKSSVLNRVTGNRHLARTSKTPGRTQLINFFVTGFGGRLVDLPGYGYAKAAKRVQQAWQEHLEAYLAARPNLVAVVLVMDIRHPFEVFDRQLIAWAQAAGMRMHVLLNKADKLKHGARMRALADAKRVLAAPNFSVQLFSAQTGMGRDELIVHLAAWLTTEGSPTA